MIPIYARTQFLGPEHSSRRIRFRTLNEFQPHARWLYENNGTVCGCVHCSNSAQIEGSTMLDLNKPRITSASNPGYYTKQISANVANPQSYVKKAPPVALALGAAASEDDFSETSSCASAPIFREHDVVWVKLDAPIRSADDTTIVLSYWPGLIVAPRRDLYLEGCTEQHMVTLFCSPIKQLF